MGSSPRERLSELKLLSAAMIPVSPVPLTRWGRCLWSLRSSPSTARFWPARSEGVTSRNRGVNCRLVFVLENRPDHGDEGEFMPAWGLRGIAAPVVSFSPEPPWPDEHCVFAPNLLHSRVPTWLQTQVRCTAGRVVARSSWSSPQWKHI